MNRLQAIITQINTSGGVILVDMDAEDCHISALLLDADGHPSWIKENNHVQAVFKETEVAIAKDFSGKISLRNKLPCIVTHIQRGVLMSVVSMQFHQYTIDSAITTRSVDMLGLKPGDEVLALIKANEITLMQD